MNVFYLGALAAPWMSGWQRCHTLSQLVGSVTRFCQVDFLRRAQPSRWHRWLERSQFEASVVEEFNRSWLRAFLVARPDVAWMEWPKLVRRETILQARAEHPDCLWVAFYDDNPFGARVDEQWQWQHYLEAVPEYDLHWVKRDSDRPALVRHGARGVRLFMHGYFEDLFYPSAERSEWRYDVSFVGTALDHRVPFVYRCLSQERLPLTIFGDHWRRYLFTRWYGSHFRPAVLGSAYGEVLRGSRISLGFVSSSNRDEYSMRTFEIPACGGLLLAERTRVHQELFREGVEAEFFDGVEECADKARFYLRNEGARARVALAGRLRCLRDDYSLLRRMRDAVETMRRLKCETTVHI